MDIPCNSRSDEVLEHRSETACTIRWIELWHRRSWRVALLSLSSHAIPVRQMRETSSIIFISASLCEMPGSPRWGGELPALLVTRAHSNAAAAAPVRAEERQRRSYKRSFQRFPAVVDATCTALACTLTSL